jgi:arginine deiminase
MWSVQNDIGKLKVVLVNEPGPECGLNLSLDLGHPAAIDDIIDPEIAAEEHQHLTFLI